LRPKETRPFSPSVLSFKSRLQASSKTSASARMVKLPRVISPYRLLTTPASPHASSIPAGFAGVGGGPWLISMTFGSGAPAGSHPPRQVLAAPENTSALMLGSTASAPETLLHAGSCWRPFDGLRIVVLVVK